MNLVRAGLLCLALVGAVDAEDCAALLPKLDVAAAQQPGNVDALLSLGVNRFRCGMSQSALQPLRKALDLAPNNSSAYFYLGVSLLALDRDEEAKTAFRRMAGLSSPDADQLFVLQKGYSRLAAALLERMSEVTPESARLNQVRAELLDMEHRPDKALDEYKQAVEKEPNVAALHYALGGAYWARFRPAEALPEYQSVIRLSPDHYMAHYKLGMALIELDRAAEAIGEFKAALRLQPGLANAHLGLAKAYARLGQTEAALAATGDCLSIDAVNQSAQYLRAQMLQKLGRKTEADEQLRRLRLLREKTQLKAGSQGTNAQR